MVILNEGSNDQQQVVCRTSLATAPHPSCTSRSVRNAMRHCLALMLLLAEATLSYNKDYASKSVVFNQNMGTSLEKLRK
ncbi:hypothetical protein KIN20_032046 [Parelaphostrongylus tenuis]|uniref:Uncharacterized protein n=1 Tax=Parelaphostrongylus tenuis TaxID=148309 RepID=A0AAD5WH82_PARTN|nr:hypothetical protein KIN20_032046 [Parelaphostrongylus tenuis]